VIALIALVHFFPTSPPFKASTSKSSVFSPFCFSDFPLSSLASEISEITVNQQNQ
jgi:hypothetical protein